MVTRGLRRNIGTAVAVAAALIVGGVGATFAAQLAGSEGADGPSTPGTPATTDNSGASGQLIRTSGATFDPTVLTTFIPGTAFGPYQGTTLEADLVRYESPDSSCVSADVGSGGVLTEFRAGVELPDGAQIKRVTFFGQDSDATNDIGVRLSKTEFVVGTPNSRSFVVVDSFDTSAVTGNVVVSGANNLSLVVGSADSTHVFATLHVQVWNSAAANHKLCGAEVEYLVPAASTGATVFYPVPPYRTYDSRLDMAPVVNGPLAAGPGRLVPVKDGRNITTGVINRPNAIPAEATAVAYTVAAILPTGSGFLFVGPGDATDIDASSINWDTNTNGAIANSGTVLLDAARQVRVFAGGSPGASAHFTIDISGYYGPLAHPNMGN